VNMLETRMSELEVMKKEKTKVSSDISTVHEKYAELNQQLEAMQSLFGEYQVREGHVYFTCLSSCPSWLVVLF